MLLFIHGFGKGSILHGFVLVGRNLLHLVDCVFAIQRKGVLSIPLDIEIVQVTLTWLFYICTSSIYRTSTKNIQNGTRSSVESKDIYMNPKIPVHLGQKAKLKSQNILEQDKD